MRAHLALLQLQLHFVIPLLIDWHQRACTHGWKFRHRESTLHLLPLALVHSVVRSLAPWSPRPQIHHLELVLAQTPAPAPEPEPEPEPEPRSQRPQRPQPEQRTQRQPQPHAQRNVGHLTDFTQALSTTNAALSGLQALLDGK